jgi:hypothetical protein
MGKQKRQKWWRAYMKLRPMTYNAEQQIKSSSIVQALKIRTIEVQTKNITMESRGELANSVLPRVSRG